jgi:hypothetical protein
MDLKATQRLLAELYTDGALRQRFAVSPADVAKEFGIAPAEAHHLEELSAAQLAGYARCLKRKRLSELRRALPGTCRALGADLAGLFDLHAARYQPQGVNRQVDDAVAFAESLRDARHRIAEPARYEANWLRIRHGGFWPRVAFFRSDPRETATGGTTEYGSKRRLIACWFRLGGRPRHMAIRW